MKKILSAILALALMLQPFTAGATDLTQAFTDLLGPGTAASASAPGRFSSASRTGVTLGGFEMRTPRASVPTLLSASAPRISAGCNGISAHFGGFSFISGTDFTKLMEQIASGAALGFVASLVMKSLCPMCEAVVQELKSAAQAAARLAKDACNVGEQFARAYFSGSDSQGSAANACEKVTADSGAASDTLESAKDLCLNLKAASKSLNEWADSAGVDKADVNGEHGLGNVTWHRLKQLEGPGGGAESLGRKLMLINMMGAEISVADGERVGCDARDGTPIEVGVPGPDGKVRERAYCPPMTDPKTLVGYYMCGARPGALPTPATSARVVKYCSTYADGSSGASAGVNANKLWTCEDEDKCYYLKASDASTTITGEGILVQINKLLTEAVTRVRTGNQGFTDATGRKIIALVDAAPYPLYQAINAAAVYPAAGTEIIDAMSVAVAEQFAHAMLNETLRVAGRGGATGTISREQASAILDFLGKLRSQSEASMALLGNQFAVQQGLTEQIRTINNTIQRQVLSEDMLSSGNVSQALNRALAPNGASATAP